MNLPVSDFINRVEYRLNEFIEELQEETGFCAEQHVRAWQNSLPELSKVLAAEPLRRLHMLIVEYRLPGSSSWCDVVLLGRNQRGPGVAILELKHWDTKGDEPGPRENLITHKGQWELHPSDQVRGYVQYCSKFHSVVLEHKAGVDGCVFFTRKADLEPYRQAPHEHLASQYPLFQNDIEKVRDYLAKTCSEPDEEFANKFVSGVYRQDRNFCEAIAQQIRHPESSPFVLLGPQRLGLELCLARISAAIDEDVTKQKKTVIVIKGPPGSGKSVLAARLWAELYMNDRLKKDDRPIVFATTSAAHRTVWEEQFEMVSKRQAGHGVVKAANDYAPQTLKWMGQLKSIVGKDTLDPVDWRQWLHYVGDENKHQEDEYLVSIVDEAHALINAEKPRCSDQHGWPTALGPQGYHIIRSSRISIFLMDSEQGFRDREATTPDDLIKWAHEVGAVADDPISLEGSQFRAGGSVEYIDWLDGMLGLRGMPETKMAWRAPGDGALQPGKMLFEVVNDPLMLDEKLRDRQQEGASVRLMAAYGREWKTKKAPRPHLLSPGEMDFDIHFTRNGQQRRWSKIWNYAPGADYTMFILGTQGSPMSEDPLQEVGCPYVVRGFDYDYLGILWLKDLTFWAGGWRFDLNHIFESGWRQTIADVKREKKSYDPGPAHEELRRRLKQAYRILFSRAIKGVYVWFEDDETRRYVESLLPDRTALKCV